MPKSERSMNLQKFSAAVMMVCVLCVGASADDVRATIEVNNAGFIQDLLRGDAKAVAERYTADAAVIAPGASVARGTAAIEAFWAASITAGVEDLELRIGAVESAGDLAFEEGIVAITNADGKTTEQRYVVVWKRVGTEWKLHRDIWN
jgi:ketosteroid isomerase-like protein